MVSPSPAQTPAHYNEAQTRLKVEISWTTPPLTSYSRYACSLFKDFSKQPLDNRSGSNNIQTRNLQRDKFGTVHKVNRLTQTMQNLAVFVIDEFYAASIELLCPRI